jgi:hypothetical protein
VEAVLAEKIGSALITRPLAGFFKLTISNKKPAPKKGFWWRPKFSAASHQKEDGPENGRVAINQLSETYKIKIGIGYCRGPQK